MKQNETIQVDRHTGTFGRRLILAGWTALRELCEQIVTMLIKEEL